ncbi:fla cluster protein FlaD [Natronomonas pharaonis DSM 2160]|uniref:Fla cluster protein FlaD n=1 Tax=Natronomonas pharaonis (strain ATCC 35678 / DSM 2160 / CIP 103997 / JCM 8858 / NBRC 14720 / NCIMB 2260 / Gabara) TaxID=348780 RepID=A0A1U7EWG0_NATPD|nr:FlaD/FlaE family flagellar protein [Natronomonas pharaonis]CAI49434.1 fla cluster protein FlaD [Natronomonas pharaonis DSM 2160]
MSSQLNPRDYDLGELRDAVRETTRRERRNEQTRDEGLDDADGEGGQPIEPERSQQPRETKTETQGRRSNTGSQPERPERRDRRRGDEPAEYQPASQRRPGQTAAAERDDPETPAEQPQTSVGGAEDAEAESTEALTSSESEAGDAFADASSAQEDAFESPGGDDSPSAATPTASTADTSTAPSATAESEPSPGADAGDDTDSIADDPAAYLQSRHEKRRAAGREPETGPDTERSDPAIAQEDFELLARLSENSDDRPYLQRLPDEYSAQLEIFDWLDTMVAKAGHESTVEALAYYESVGWLSEESRAQLEDFADGLAAADAGGHPLTVADHRESLLYIARLAHRLGQ